MDLFKAPISGWNTLPTIRTDVRSPMTSTAKFCTLFWIFFSACRGASSAWYTETPIEEAGKRAFTTFEFSELEKETFWEKTVVLPLRILRLLSTGESPE